MQTLITFIILLFSTSLSAETFDRSDKIHGVSLKSGKENSVRIFRGRTQKLLPYPIELVKGAVTNFGEKCNNSFKDQRKFTPKDRNCKFHNEQLVETIVVRDIRNKDEFKSYSDAYLLGRQVYNRTSYGYYELVTINESLNDKNQRTVTVTTRMLDDKEANRFVRPEFSKESSFKSSSTTFTLTETSPGETHLKYEYQAETDHWLLNKEVSVPQVFASISRSVNEFLKSVEIESSSRKRALASKE